MTFSNIHQHDWRRKSLLPEIYLEKLIFTFGMTLPLSESCYKHISTWFQQRAKTSWCHILSLAYFRPYHLKTSVHLRMFYFTRKSVFCPPSPAPSLLLRLCVACGLDSCPRTIHCGRTRPPSVLCFLHSSALTSARLQEERRFSTEPAVCGKRPTLTSAVWLADLGRVGGPRHLWQHKPPTTMQSKGCFTYHMLFCGIN